MSEIDNAALTLHDAGAERALLGAVLLDSSTITNVRRRIIVEDFYAPAHTEVFRAILDLDDKREPIDPITVWAEIQKRGAAKMLPGGAVYIHELMSAAPSASTATYYANIVKDHATRRQLAGLALQAQQRAAAVGDGAPETLIESLRDGLDQLALKRLQSDIPAFGDVINNVLEEIEALSEGEGRVAGVPTGFTDLDHKVKGLQPGQMVVIAGRPGMGKSTLAVDIARNASVRHGKSVLVFSLEMSVSELTMRIICAESRIELEHIRSGKITDTEWVRLVETSSKIANVKLGIDDTANITMATIRAKAREWQRRNGLDLIVIDYLQLMSSDRRVESRQQEVSEISRNAKLIAKEFGIPVIALSQLNRGSEQRSDKKPLLSDLRESGSLEQDADVVLLVHREEVYNPEQRVGEADIIIAKQRSGPTGTVILSAQLHYSRFADIYKPVGEPARVGDSLEGL